MKLWDVRRMDSVVSEIKISNTTGGRTSQPPSAQYSNQMKVETVRWSTAEPGVLSVAVGDAVQDFDTSSSSRPVLIRVNHSKRDVTIQDIALYTRPKLTTNNIPQNEKEATTETTRLVNVLYSRRMIVMLEDRTLCDMAKHGGAAPVAISRRDGRLVHALGPTVWIGSTTTGPSAMENSNHGHDEDISATMMRRARCFRQSRYSMMTSQNIKVRQHINHLCNGILYPF